MSIRRPADDDLDRLLAEAEWPEPSVLQVQRLSRAWHELRNQRRRRRRVAMSLAASLVIVAGVLAWRSVPRAQPLIVVQTPETQPSTTIAKGTAVTVAEASLARDPNAYEQVLLIARMRAVRQSRQARALSKVDSPLESPTVSEAAPVASEAPRSPAEDALDELLARRTPEAIAEYLSFVANSKTRRAALAALGRSSAPPIDLLATYLANPRKKSRLAAAQALATLDDQHAVERLVESVPGIGRQEALMALLASRSPRASELVDQARRDEYLMASVRAAEQQLSSMQNQNGEYLP